ncbi:MAG: metal ABC transporter substrate-binding protein [Xanthobacteraceae bacterium]|jgi:zinc/manganese transport system substrate-binding protein
MPTRRHVLTLVVAAAVGRVSAGRAQSRLRAVATFSILGDFLKNVAGDRANVSALVGPDGDVHVYAPTPADAKTLALANLIVVNGLGLEGWLDRLIAASGSKAPVVVASRGIHPRETTDATGSNSSVSDPHAWQSVANAEIYVENIRDGLIAVDPVGKEFYETSAAHYLAEFAALDSEIKAAMATIPPERRKIITTHSAFGYFGDAYGLQFIAPEGLSTSAEPSARDVANIIAQIRTQKIPAVFLENIADPRLLQQIAAETGAKIGGTIYSDSLSPAKGPAATYIDLMRHNAREFQRALTS